MSIKQKIIDIIAKKLGLDPDEVTPEKSFIEDLNTDSLDSTELIMNFEEEFGNKYGGFEISEEDAEKLKTVQDVIDYIEKKKGEFETNHPK